MRVISRTSVMHFKGTRKTIPEIAHELGVSAVIEGSALRSGDRVRITAQLIDAGHDRHLWAQSYERELKDVLVLQDEMAQAIAAEIRAALTSAARARASSRQPVNPAAYEAYLKGRHFWNQRNRERIR